MYRSIIVPLDGSARSQAALPVAAAFAHVLGARLDLVRVHLDDRPDLRDDPSWDAMFRDGELHHLEALALAYQPIAGSPVGANLLSGPVVSTLVQFTEGLCDPLFFMAGRGRTGLRRALLGSTADGLVRHGKTPVLVLRDRGADDPPAWRYRRKPFARIVLPLDGTVHAESGIAHAVAIARATGAKLLLVRVVGPVMTSAVLSAFTTQPLLSFDDTAALRNGLADEYLQLIVDRIRAGGHAIDVSTEVALATDAASAIIESCRRTAADLVVVPSHGRGASRLLAGAVGDRLLRDGPDALLFVRPPNTRVPAGLTPHHRRFEAHRVPSTVGD